MGWCRWLRQTKLTISALVLLSFVSLVCASPSLASDDVDKVTVTASTPGSGTTPTTEHTSDPTPSADTNTDATGAPGGVCAGGAGGAVDANGDATGACAAGGGGQPPPTPAELAQQAIDQFIPHVPEIHTNPPQGKAALVGLPVWLYLDDTQWVDGITPIRADAGENWTAATIKPARVVWNMGDGTKLTCDGPGKAYKSPSAGRPCTYTYKTASTYTVSVTITWRADFTSNPAADLPPQFIARTSPTFELVVGQAQAQTG
jgi:hypothetical protein